MCQIASVVVSMSLADLSPPAVGVLNSVLTNGHVLASGDPEEWDGVHILHLQVISEFASGVEMWLVDRSLPNTLQHAALLGGEPQKMCRLRLLSDSMPPWTIQKEGYFSCRAQCFFQDGIRKAQVVSPFDFWCVGSRALNLPINWVHTLCGAFNGWHQAAEAVGHMHGIKTGSTIAIDNDLVVCKLGSRNTDASVIKAPFQELLHPTSSNIVICSDVAQPQWPAAIHNGDNMFWTASFPCPPYSRASTTRAGLEIPSGRAFLFVLKAARACQPLVIGAENVDGIRSHGHFRSILKFASWAGYRVAWSQISCLSEVSNCIRRRWLAVSVREGGSVF